MKKKITAYVHLEIPVDNMQRAQSFYEIVFHWRGKKLPIPMDYVMLDECEESRAGLISREERKEFKQTSLNIGPISYLFVKNIEAYEQKIKQAVPSSRQQLT
ncbi:hypothetical protein COV18_01405 [Candidatus Woesearchaeota archaeon CG10_big_fil_rev_8_21_14_0_10_37_12]|nr:MAG: hypothetical protein COV18_01405 [Candidatus Woesearchaeota archaeon CG10_big_fil_rev_8_21_14_0_10_37_12]